MNQNEARTICERLQHHVCSIGLSGYAKVFEGAKPEDLLHNASWGSLTSLDQVVANLQCDLCQLREAVTLRQQALAEYFRCHGWPEFETTTDPMSEFRRRRDDREAERKRKDREEGDKIISEYTTKELAYQRNLTAAGFAVGGRGCEEYLETQKAALERGELICDSCGQSQSICDNPYCGE